MCLIISWFTADLIKCLFENAYTKHPYRWTTIGKEQYIDQAKYGEFMDFYKTSSFSQDQ